jgi:hypothetical protein
MRAYWATPLRALGLATADLACLACLACSSGSTGKPSANTPPPASSPGDDGGGATTPPPTPTSGGNTNPEGIAYPSPATGYGRSARSGNTPGSIMENFVFLGYPNAVVTPRPVAISLADYYDPCSKRFKLIHLTVASVWCVPCNQETDAMVAAKSQIDSQGVVVLQALADGPMQGTGATQDDLNRWIASHQPTFTELLDPGLANLSLFFNAAAVPWNCDLDPRTMEILDASTGWTGMVTTELAPALRALPATPSYPLPACN